MPGPVGPAIAAAAYGAQAPGAGAAAASRPAAGGNSFAATMERVLQDAVQTGRQADAASSQALLGGGNVSDVVMAVARADIALQTAVAVRDRVVTAYQDIMRMPI